MAERKEIAIALIGPSGAGKTSLVYRVVQNFPKTKLIISYTTRKPRLRPDGTMEQDGVDYFFVSKTKFKKLKSQGFFFESSDHHDASYGTPKDQCTFSTHNIIFDVDPNGARELKKQIPDLIQIFIHPESTLSLSRRLYKRGGLTDDKIKSRIKRYEDFERLYASECDYQFTNYDGKFKQFFAKVAMTIFKEQGGFMLSLDSLSGAGGSTLVSNLINHYKGGRHIDSGSFYRVLAWLLGIGRNISPKDPYLETILKENHATFDIDAFNIKSKVFKSPKVDAIVPLWSQNAQIREEVFWLLMKSAYHNDEVFIVCEGRDMTSEVFSEAQLLVYLSCSAHIRAKRRHKDSGYKHLPFNEVLEAINKRDLADRTRKESPFNADVNPRVMEISNERDPELVLQETVKHIEIARKSLNGRRSTVLQD